MSKGDLGKIDALTKTILIKKKQTDIEKKYTLVHEMFHGFDASKGILDRRFALGTGGALGEEIGEIRAVYNTNLIRQQMGIKNLRGSYSNPNIPLLKNGNPINIEIKITDEMIRRFNTRNR